MDNIIDLSSNNFKQEVINSDMPVLVDFWASYCGPCKMIGKVIEDLSDDFNGKIKFTKIQIDGEEDLSDITSEYGVKALPTLLIVRNGEVVHRIVGMINKNNIIDYLEETIKN